MIARKRLEIVIDAAAVPQVTALAEQSGAKGYTIVPHVSGKGHRGIRRGRDVFAEGENAMIVVIARAEVVASILLGLAPLLDKYAGIASVADVMVLRGDYF